MITSFVDANDVDVSITNLPQSQTDRQTLFPTIDWDIGQENGYFLPVTFARGAGQYSALDLTTVPELSSAIATISEEVRAVLTTDGHLLGFPMNLHRENTMHYSLALVSTPPTTLAELQTLCDDYVAAAEGAPRPLAISSEDWVNRILFEALLPPEVVSGEASDPVPAFTAALSLIRYYYDNDCFAVADSWSDAAQLLIDGDAAMFIHGDWAKGYLVQNGERPGVDFGVAPAPGSEGGFYYGVDAFAVNADSEQRELAIRFAATALSPAVQIAFSERKGSTPAVRIDDPSQIDDASLRAAYEQLVAAREAGEFLPAPTWLANNAQLIVPLISGTQTVEQVAQSFAAVYPD